MTLIRAGFAARAVRALDAGPEAAVPEPDVEDPRDREIERLGADLSRALERLASLEASFKQEVAAAEDKALAAARAERSDAEDRQAARLELALGDALERWSERLEALEPLAVAIAGSVLDNIFGSADWAASHLAAAVRRQVDRLGSGAATSIQVAPDMLDELGLDERLASRVTADPRLAKHEVRIGLRLGDLDLSPAVQWAGASERLRHYLDEVLGGA